MMLTPSFSCPLAKHNRATGNVVPNIVRRNRENNWIHQCIYQKERWFIYVGTSSETQRVIRVLGFQWNTISWVLYFAPISRNLKKNIGCFSVVVKCIVSILLLEVRIYGHIEWLWWVRCVKVVSALTRILVKYYCGATIMATLPN